VEECEVRCSLYENGFAKQCPLRVSEETRLFYALLKGLPKNFEDLETRFPSLYKKVRRYLDEEEDG